MAHISNRKRIVYVEPVFRLRWYRLDLADVQEFQSFVRHHFKIFPEEVRQSVLNLYNDLSSPKNPRNIKFL